MVGGLNRDELLLCDHDIGLGYRRRYRRLVALLTKDYSKIEVASVVAKG